ncbi:MAG TPA: 50S ribosomal protein L13 [Chloroflexi bacterium]|nr:50S ribosomal protein L13 [Chloroflexota bacterium]HCU99012.1 50S ribosomal protein L13 [Chloroflexota bacterium]|tara:strand:+ start:3021 stop:3491 length:471 start_codon:yes stop_codon:yes gene_type:complete
MYSFEELDTVNTYVTKGSEVKQEWLLIDASGHTLGRLASEIASILRGKHKVNYAPNLDLGDYVVVVNATKIVVSGNRLNDKMYRRHTGFPGGLIEIPLKTMLERHPDRVIKFAVRGMLPKTKLGRKMLKKLKVYPGADHPHDAQTPRLLDNLQKVG